METEHDDESQDEAQTVSVIQVHFEEPFGTEEMNSTHLDNSGVIKGKYYKQTYRTAWESMPDFKGWLRGVQGEPTRAYCLYCQKTLHAHRLSLLKHTCTIRHQKAAQMHAARKNKEANAQSQEVLIAHTTSEHIEDSQSGAEGEPEIEYTEECERDEEEQENEDVDDDEEGIPLESLPVQFQKQFRQQILNPMTPTKPPISTHVLDSTKGTPVTGLQVSLYKLIEGRWTFINEGLTNSDGRFANFLERSDFTPGRYKLHFDVDRYFEARKQDTLYPFIEIIIDCKTPHEHYHVPLLLSPFSYTTYKGS